jgi:putative membrane protein
MTARALAAATMAALFAPAATLAHGPDAVVGPGAVWRAWNLDPVILAGLALLAWLHLRGVRQLRERGADRVLPRWRTAAFAAGWLALAVALVSPLDALGETLFAAHMVQHLLLLLAAPMLLLAGRPLATGVWGLPTRARRVVGQALTSAPGRRARALAASVAAVVALHSIAIWIWHAPALYELALRSRAAHYAEHASFFLTALLFWAMVARSRAGHASGAGVAVLAVFALALQGGALGMLLTFAATAWYPAHEAGAAAWGMTGLEDQRVAGVLMWIPPGVVYTAAALWTMAAWLGGMDRRWRPAPEEVI